MSSAWESQEDLLEEVVCDEDPGAEQQHEGVPGGRNSEACWESPGEQQAQGGSLCHS